jgi:hypothetical protein
LRETRATAFQTVRRLQHELVESYLDDIAKHAGSLKAVRIASVLKNIPEQLARETTGSRKFLFKDVVTGRSNYEVLEGPIEWLIRAELVHRVPICRTVQQPLSAHTEPNAFMLYLFDTGLLGAMLHLDPAIIHQYDFGHFKGFLADINTKAKSMKTYRERYQPEKAILFSGCGINQMDNGLLHTPLYLAGMTKS